MVINVLTLSQFQNLQNPNANSKARPKQVKKNTFIRNTAKMRKRKNTEQFVSSVWQVFSFSAKSINQSPPLWHSLKHWTCASASQHSQPGAQQQKQHSPLWLHLIIHILKYGSTSFSQHIWAALRWPFMVQQIRGFLLSAADVSAEDCFVIYLRHSRSSCAFLNCFINVYFIC